MLTSSRRPLWLALIIAIVVLVVAYLGTGWYAEKIAKQDIAQLAEMLTQNNPNIEDISYRSLSASPWSLWTHQVTLRRVVVTFKQPEVQLLITRIDLMSYEADANGFLQKLNLAVTGISGAYTPPKVLPTDAEPFINSAEHLSADLVLRYRASTGTAQIDWTLNHGEQQWLRSASTIDHLTFAKPFSPNDWQQTVLAGFEHAQLSQSRSEVSIQIHKTQAELKALSPEFAAAMAAVGHAKLNLSINGSGQYSAATKISEGHLAIEMPKGFRLSFANKTVDVAPELSPIVQVLENIDDPAALTQESQTITDKIALLQIRYQDQGLLPQVLNLAAAQLHETPAQLQMDLSALVTDPTQLPNIPVIKAAAAQVGQFINHPGTLTVTVQPKPPIGVQELNTKVLALMTRYSQNQQDSTLTDEQRAAVVAQINHDINALLMEIGFSITAK